jgi:hypothetical protein
MPQNMMANGANIADGGQTMSPYTERIYSRVVVEEAEVATTESPLAGLANTPLVGLREAVAAAEQHITCSSGLSDELEVALVFATRKVANGRSQGLTIDQVAAINLYTQESFFYVGLNGAFGGWGEGGGHAAVPHYLPYMKILVGALEALPKAATTVYRGIRGKPLATLLKGKGVGEELVWQAPTSTTGTSDVLRDPTFFGVGAVHGERVVFVIEMESGVRIKSFSALGSIIEYYLQPFGSTQQDEDEYLLPPNMTFLIDAIDTFTNGVTQVKVHEVMCVDNGSTNTRNTAPNAGNLDSNINETITTSGYVVKGSAGTSAGAGLYAANSDNSETITTSGYVVKGSAGTSAGAGLYAANPSENQTKETSFGFGDEDSD